jgi:hypothetical protein
MFGRMKHTRSITRWLVSGLAVGLLLAACAPAPTALPPTSAPTAVPATAVPPTPAPTLARPTATAVLATAEPAPDLLAQVAAFEAAFDQQDTDGVMALFVADPHWVLLLGPLTGLFSSADSTLAVRNTLEFGYEVNTEMDATDCTVKNDTATCVVLIKDDCTPSTLDAYHFRTQFAFKDGKLASVYGRWDSADEQAFLALDSARLTWARENLPEEATAYSTMALEAGGNFGEWSKFNGTGEQGPGKLTPTEFGQAVERICTGYAAASQ